MPEPLPLTLCAAQGLRQGSARMCVRCVACKQGLFSEQCGHQQGHVCLLACIRFE